MFKFSMRSEKKLEEAHPDLRKIAYTVKSLADIDFDISSAYRSVEEQNKLYQIGRTVEKNRSPVTYVDGINIKSNHNYKPARAIDIFAYKGKKASYAVKDLRYLADLFMAAAVDLKKRGAITHEIRWGGNFPKVDMPHFELIG